MDIGRTVELIRAKQPLIHHITNWVTIYDCANITRSLGALPIMSHAPEEVADMTAISQALVLNIGTLTLELVHSMKLSGKKANQIGIPIVLDAVGAGATVLRTRQTREILSEVNVPILKGNSGEIATIAGISAEVKGVESISVEGDIREIARDLAKNQKATVVVTGKEDLVTDGDRIFVVKNGHELMGRVVGTGCMAASVIASFAAVSVDTTTAAAEALAFYGIAGESAAQKAGGPGTFIDFFIDAIHNIGNESLKNREKVDIYEG